MGKYNIENILNMVSGAFEMPSTALTPIPAILLNSGAKNRTGLSAKNIASRIINRQSEAGAPVGPANDGGPNISEAMEVIRVEELVNALLTEAKIEIAVAPGVSIMASGGNAGGPVISNGYTIEFAEGSGIIR